MSELIRIGTRGSELALWQANFIKKKLSAKNIASQIIKIKSEGEVNTVTPLYQLGIQGIFTKALDIALLENKIDIAVHSLKDVPTKLAEGLELIACPERGNFVDCLVYKDENLFNEFAARKIKIATSSLRRKAQWLNKYPNHNIVDIRGNINSRLQKLIENKELDGVIFAKAGLERINLQVPFSQDLNWMLPSASQGCLAVVCRENDNEIIENCNKISDKKTNICVNAERQFLNKLNAGCTMPIACLAILEKNTLIIKGNMLSIDGTLKAKIEIRFAEKDYINAGKIVAEELKEQPNGKEIYDSLLDLRNS